MNKNTDIDALLRRLPVEQTGADFTANVVSRIAVSPAVPHRLNGWSIAGICVGSIAVATLIWWTGDYFSLWSSIGVQFGQWGIYRSFSQIATMFASLFDGTAFSPVIWSGFIAGILLLLLDAVIQKYKPMKSRFRQTAKSA
jgi:hypothetical protein